MRASVMIIVVVLAWVGNCASEEGKFFVLGDWGGQMEWPYVTVAQETVSYRMGIVAEKFKPEFVVCVGDNFYTDGVKNVKDHRFKDTFEDAYTQSDLKQIPWYMIAGNHDWEGNVSAQIDYSNFSHRWKYPNYWYNFTHVIESTNTTIEFVIIDTVILAGQTDEQHVHGKAHDNANQEWDWIEMTLAHSIADWIFVAGHYPIWSVAGHGPTAILVEKLRPMLIKYNVAAYLSGHDHNMQHLNDGSVVDYFLSGAGHELEYSMAHKSNVPPNSLKYFFPPPDFVIQQGAFMTAEIIDAKTMQIHFIDGLGYKIYSYEKSNPRRK